MDHIQNDKISAVQQDVELADHVKRDSRDLDAAAQFLADHDNEQPLSPQEEKKVLRKVDFILLPMVRSFHSCS